MEKKKGSGTIMPCAWKKDEKESAWRDVTSAVDFQKHRSFKKATSLLDHNKVSVHTRGTELQNF